jgi:hypothetical protein
LIEAVILSGGGHIVEFRFNANSGRPDQNTMWQPPWRTADPGTHEYDSLVPQYGDPETGRFLASYAGHALCLDGFGPPSAADAEKGVPLHGEAAITDWQHEQYQCDGTTCTKAAAKLPVAGLRVTRQFHLFAGESVLRVDERVSNLLDTPRDIQWVQHATFGPPFVSVGVSTVNASVCHGMTWPCGYENQELLPDNTPFSWPNVQTTDGKLISLREPFATPGRGLVASVHQDRSRKFSFVAALNAPLGLSIGYCFRSDTFPWLTIWEENRARANPPWNGTTHARGMEFGTTPFPIGKDETAKRDDLFGQKTSRHLGAKGELQARWLMFLAVTPSNWRIIDDVRIGSDTIELIAGSENVNVRAAGVQRFLEDPIGAIGTSPH